MLLLLVLFSISDESKEGCKKTKDERERKEPECLGYIDFGVYVKNYVKLKRERCRMLYAFS